MQTIFWFLTWVIVRCALLNYYWRNRMQCFTQFSILLNTDYVENLLKGSIKMSVVVLGGGITMGDVCLHSSLSILNIFLCTYYNFLMETNQCLVQMPHYLNKATTKSWWLVTTLLLEIPPCEKPVSLRFCMKEQLSRERNRVCESYWLPIGWASESSLQELKHSFDLWTVERKKGAPETIKFNSLSSQKT